MMFLSTKDEVHRRKIIEEFGMVTGVIVSSRFFVSDFIAKIRNFLGFEVLEYTKMLEESKEKAKNRMIEQAEKLGANAILCIRFVNTPSNYGTEEVLVYGTAVKIK